VRSEEVLMAVDAFAPRLKELREQAGLSQKGLADRAGLALSAIGHLEQGLRKPTWETVLALAEALGVTCEAFTAPASTDEPTPRGRPRKQTEGAPPVPPAPPPAEDLQEEAKSKKGRASSESRRKKK
jgi:transcriptional regulator with XRE-family HTH domain